KPLVRIFLKKRFTPLLSQPNHARKGGLPLPPLQVLSRRCSNAATSGGEGQCMFSKAPRKRRKTSSRNSC
uniref:Uncharacterized protein n=1 Tax=Aegilops tauschii subsp. strangulata TaxID=200361 RepID=A0A453J7V2_AEGTS